MIPVSQLPRGIIYLILKSYTKYKIDRDRTIAPMLYVYPVDSFADCQNRVEYSIGAIVRGEKKTRHGRIF